MLLGWGVCCFLTVADKVPQWQQKEAQKEDGDMSDCSEFFLDCR